MTYKTILVCLNDLNRTDELLEVATKIAIKNSAHLIGLYVKTFLQITSNYGQVDIPMEVFENHAEQEENTAKELEIEFNAKTNLTDISAEWSSVNAYSTDIKGQILNRSRCCDLIITSQGDPLGPDTGQEHLAHNLVMEAGRPILVLPREQNIQSIGEYPLVAWNASHQASRAVFDAIPFLKKAKNTKIAWLDPQGFPDKDIEMAGSEIATSLSRHGIHAHILQTKTQNINIGSALLDIANNQGSDLIVMGGYGHSRFREYIFGGATYHILTHMNVPVFLSH